MADRGAVPFGATRHKATWFATLPAMLKFALRPGNHAPLAFNQVITPLVMGNQALAFEMYSGRFEFAGQTIFASAAEIFTCSHSNAEWQEALNNLDWLKHFNASKRSLHDQYAMRLLRYWSKQQNHRRTTASQVKIMCALATHGHDIARRCDQDIQFQYFALVSSEIKSLTKIRPRNAEEFVAKALALFHCLTSFYGFEYLGEQAHRLLDQNIDHVILPDGGHVSRQVQKLIAFLELALPLQQARKSLVPNSLLRAIESGLAMLRLLQMGDGGVTLLAGEDIDDRRLQRLMAFHQPDVPTPNPALDSGFARIDHGKATLIADTSKALAIEFADGEERLFHARFNLNGENAPCQLTSAPQGSALTMQTSEITRTCFLSGDGSDLRVEDAFANPAPQEITICVAPSVKLSSLMEGQAIMLITPDHCVWHFKQRGGFAHIRQSAMQSEIVITLIKGKSRACINWSLKKQPKPPKPVRKKSTPEPDLLS